MRVVEKGEEMDHNRARDLYALGKSAMKLGDLEAAAELFQQSITKYPHFKTLELLGECLLKENQHSEAIVYLAAAAGLGLKQFRSRFLLAKAHLAVGETGDAVNQLKEALRLNPNYKSAYKLLITLSANEEES